MEERSTDPMKEVEGIAQTAAASRARATRRAVLFTAVPIAAASLMFLFGGTQAVRYHAETQDLRRALDSTKHELVRVATLHEPAKPVDTTRHEPPDTGSLTRQFPSQLLIDSIRNHVLADRAQMDSISAVLRRARSSVAERSSAAEGGLDRRGVDAVIDSVERLIARSRSPRDSAYLPEFRRIVQAFRSPRSDQRRDEVAIERLDDATARVAERRRADENLLILIGRLSDTTSNRR